MYALMILGILVLGILAASTFQLVSLSGDVVRTQKLMNDKTTLSNWNQSIQANMRPYGEDRVLLVPNGVDLKDKPYQTPPSHINLPRTNSLGYDIVYCPFALTSGISLNRINAGIKRTYSAEVITGIDGIEYIASVSSSIVDKNNGMMAALLSPLSNEEVSCLDIEYDTAKGDYVLTKGSALISVISDTNLVVSNRPVVVIPSVSDDISELVSDWQAVLPDVLTIDLRESEGLYQTSGYSFVNSTGVKNKAIIIKGGSSKNTIINSESPVTYTFENTSVTLDNVGASSSVKFEFINSDVFIKNSNLLSSKFISSNIIVDGDVLLDSYVSPVVLENSILWGQQGATLNVGKSNSNVGLTSNNSKISVGNLKVINNKSAGVGLLLLNTSKLNITQAINATGSYFDSVISAAEDSSVQVSNSTILIDSDIDTFMYAEGPVSLIKSSINFASQVNSGIVLSTNAVLNLSDTVIGSSTNAPSSGIVDIGGTQFITGALSVIYSTSTCWNGDIFSGASSNTNGATSQATISYEKAANRSIWSCVTY